MKAHVWSGTSIPATFTSAMEASGLSLKAMKPSSIVNFGCGTFREAPELLSSCASESPLHVVALDIRDEALSKAEQNILRAFSEIGRAPSLELHNIVRNPSRAAPKEFQLGIFRHQNYWFEPAAWSSLFESALEGLSADGAIFVTSYFAREHALMLKRFETLGGRLEASGLNPVQYSIEQPDKRVDGYWALIRKPR